VRPRAYNGRGGALGRKKEYNKAIADYTEAIRLDPNDAGNYAGRGYVWYQ
jgi:Flp pilus assembly protein TadD